MMYHHTKLGYKGFSASEDIIQLNINWNLKPPHWPWPWTQQSNIYTGICWSTIKLIFAAKESLVKKIVIFLLDIIHTLTVTLILKIGQHPNISTGHSSPWWCTTTPSLVTKKMISSEDIFFCSRQTETHGQTNIYINTWIRRFLPTYMLKQFGLWARLCFVIATIHAGVHDLVHCRTYFDFQPTAQHWCCSNHNQHYHHICTRYYMYIHIRDYKKRKVP